MADNSKQMHAIRSELFNITRELEILTKNYIKMPKIIHDWDMEKQTVKRNRELIVMLGYSLRREIELTIIKRRALEEQQILRTLQKRELNDKILAPKFLQQIIGDIKINQQDLEIPIPNEHIRVEEISKILIIDAYVTNGDIAVSINIPLVAKETHKLYNMHSLGSI